MNIVEMDHRISEEVRHPEVMQGMEEVHSDEHDQQQMVSLFENVPPPQPQTECE